MIGHRQRLLGLAYFEVFAAHLIEGEKSAAFVNQILVHEQQFFATWVGDDDMPRPDAIKQGEWRIQR